MVGEKERLLHEIHRIGEEYYSVDHSTGGVSFYEYLARRLCEIGYVSPEAIVEQERKWVESERILNREAAFEEQRLHAEVEYWKSKDYRLGQ